MYWFNITKKYCSLQNGVQGLMLAYDFEGDVWLCHFIGGQCFELTAFVWKKLNNLTCTIVYAYSF